MMKAYRRERIMIYSVHGFEHISAEELQEKIGQGGNFLLLDVRTPAEHMAHAIEGSHLMPVQHLASRAAELPRDKEIVVYCRVGNRSTAAAAYLSNLGFNVKNLDGGIAAWDEVMDGSLVGV
jgi:rhodanese-related sulfurtransferase